MSDGCGFKTQHLLKRIVLKAVSTVHNVSDVLTRPVASTTVNRHLERCHDETHISTRSSGPNQLVVLQPRRPKL
eukprot:804670-Amphidinium_carterae.1